MKIGHGNKPAGPVANSIGLAVRWTRSESASTLRTTHAALERAAGDLGAAPARGEGGGRGVQLRGVELNQVVGSGGVETDKFTVDPSSRLRHL